MKIQNKLHCINICFYVKTCIQLIDNIIASYIQQQPQQNLVYKNNI